MRTLHRKTFADQPLAEWQRDRSEPSVGQDSAGFGGVTVATDSAYTQCRRRQLFAALAGRFGESARFAMLARGLQTAGPSNEPTAPTFGVVCGTPRVPCFTD